MSAPIPSPAELLREAQAMPAKKRKGRSFTPEQRAAQAERIKKLNADPVVSAKRIAGAKAHGAALHAAAVARKAASIKSPAIFASWTPERRAAQAEAMKKRRNDPAYVAKLNAAVSRYNSSKSKPTTAAPSPKPMPEAAPKISEEKPVAPVLTVINGGHDEGDHGVAAPTNGAALEIEQPPERHEQPDAPKEPEAAGPRVFNVNEQKRTRIKWKDSEIEIVAVKIAEFAAKAGWRHLPDVGDRMGRALVHDMLSAAQRELPQDRRRLNAPMHAFSDSIFEAVERALTAKSYLKAAEQPAAPAAEPVPVAQIAPGATDARLPAGYVAAATPAAADAGAKALADFPTAALISEAMGRLFGALGRMEAIERRQREVDAAAAKDHDRVMQRFAELENMIKAQPVAETKRLPRVAILGCQGYDLDNIKRGCEAAGVLVEFKHYDPDESPRTIKADRALSLRWLNHAWMAHIKNDFPSEKYKFIMKGGAASAVAQIKEWFPPIG